MDICIYKYVCVSVCDVYVYIYMNDPVYSGMVWLNIVVIVSLLALGLFGPSEESFVTGDRPYSRWY